MKLNTPSAERVAARTAVIEDCLKLIPPTYGEEVDLAHLPPDDPAVFEALQKADTIGMFQVESLAQMSSLPRMRPKRFYDIVVQFSAQKPCRKSLHRGRSQRSLRVVAFARSIEAECVRIEYVISRRAPGS